MIPNLTDTTFHHRDEDYQRDAVYEAQAEAEEWWWDWTAEPEDHDNDNSVPADQLDAFAARVLGGLDMPPPVFALSIPDEGDMTGGVERYGERPVLIHMHPRLLDRWKLLHELAHWVTPGDNHGPRFTSTLLAFVRSEFGSDTADCLADRFRERSVDVHQR